MVSWSLVLFCAVLTKNRSIVARKRTLHRNDSNSDDEVEEFTDLIEEERNLKKHKEM